MIRLPETSIEHFKKHQDRIFETGYLAEGPWNEKLSDLVKSITGTTCAVPTCSNGSGIVALLQIYKEYHNRSQVMIQSNTMYGVKTMVGSGNCDLVGYIDCGLDTLMPSITDVIHAVESYNGDNEHLVLLLSDIGGIINPDEEKIAAYCRNNHIVLIEDCAHSFGATLNGKHAGTFGDAGVYSFYATKAIFAGEGGVVVTNDVQIGDLVKGFTIYDRFDQVMEIGINIRPSELQALFSYSVVQDYRNIIDEKTSTAKRYIEACNDLGISFINQDKDNAKGNYYKFIVTTDTPVEKSLPSLKTTTSRVYDYYLGVENNIVKNHACLPIWYNQDSEITDRVLRELYQKG